MSFDPETIRAQYPALSITDDGRPRYYFDNPAGTQVPQMVVDRMAECMLERSANLGGYFITSKLAVEVEQDAHLAMADLLNAASPDEIIFGQNMTTITLHVARSIGNTLNAGDEIILSKMDHDANVQPWVLMARDHDLVIRWLDFDLDTFEFDLSRLDDLLNEKTKLVCIGGASNMTGTIHDIETICRKTREAGAWSYIDAVQSVPHVSTDVQKDRLRLPRVFGVQVFRSAPGNAVRTPGNTRVARALQGPSGTRRTAVVFRNRHAES